MKECHNGEHSLTEIYRIYINVIEDHVINWCKFCGAVVVDVESDGRRMGVITPMQFSEVFKMLCYGKLKKVDNEKAKQEKG